MSWLAWLILFILLALSSCTGLPIGPEGEATVTLPPLFGFTPTVTAQPTVAATMSATLVPPETQVPVLPTATATTAPTAVPATATEPAPGATNTAVPVATATIAPPQPTPTPTPTPAPSKKNIPKACFKQIIPIGLQKKC